MIVNIFFLYLLIRSLFTLIFLKIDIEYLLKNKLDSDFNFIVNKMEIAK